MSRLADLIRELCPYGVPVLALGEVAEIRTGVRPTNEDLAAGGPVRYLNGGAQPSGAVSAPNTAGGTITIPSRGSVGLVSYQAVPFWCGPLCYAVRSRMATIDSRYLYFALKVRQSSIVALQQTGSIPALNKKELVGVQVPVPPLEVQREIVRILDAFTELEASLDAELAAREGQQAYYRRQFIDEAWLHDCAPLGEVADVRAGWGFPLRFQGNGSGDIPFYKVSDMNAQGNSVEMGKSKNYVSEDVARQLGCKPSPAGTLVFPKIGAAIATNKKRLLTTRSAYDNNVFGIIPGERLSPRYLYYLFCTLDLSRFASDSGAVPSIRKSTLEAFLVPVPPLAEQATIVDALDALSRIVNDMSIGLPAELAARRKQYGYYRDKLLTFPEPMKGSLVST